MANGKNGLNRLRSFYEEEYPRVCGITGIPKDDDFTYSQVLHELKPYASEGVRVLDLGCNVGNLSLYMANLGCCVTGIDLARNAVATAVASAKHVGINAEFTACDFMTEWNETDTFDLVFCSHVIEHIPEDEQFLKKIYSATKLGGHLILIVPSSYSTLAKISKMILGRFPFDEEVGHLRRYNVQQLEAIVRRAGYTINRISFMDGILRDWVYQCKFLHPLHFVLGRRYIRSIFNATDSLLANLCCPSSICIHAIKRKEDRQPYE